MNYGRFHGPWHHFQRATVGGEGATVGGERAAVCKVQARKHYISLPSVVEDEAAASLIANGPLYSCLLILPSCPPKCFYY